MLNLILLHLTSLVPIRKLPPFHGAHWSACFRHLLRPHLGEADASGLMVVPMPNPPSVFERGESIHLGLAFKPELAGAVAAALAVFNEPKPGSGHFQPGVTIRLEGVLCRISGVTWNPTVPSLLTAELLQPEIERLCGLDRFTLRLDTPMRLTRPAGGKETGHRYCDNEFFTRCGASASQKLDALLVRIRDGGNPSPTASALQITGGRFEWQEVSYGNGFVKTIGGIVGEITIAGTCDKATARQLVAGQYLGAGKNAAFGFGFYTIPELDMVRRIAPLTTRRTITLAEPGIAVWAVDDGLIIAHTTKDREMVPWHTIDRIMLVSEYLPSPGLVSRIMSEHIPLFPA